MTTKHVQPSISETAFNCPHCGALTSQTWYELGADIFREKNQTPRIFKEDETAALIEEGDNVEMREMIDTYLTKMVSGQVFLEQVRGGQSRYYNVHNLWASQCYNCDRVAVWQYDKMISPFERHAPEPNEDLPNAVRVDYEEASTILVRSPRGAAALLRLGIQKLCMHLGEPGKNINTDIASLVQKGLDARVQQALDVVRVIGNNAVHPGQIDLKDDSDTATTLFGLVNLITDVMISQPKHIKGVYNGLPQSAKNQITERDKKAGL